MTTPRPNPSSRASRSRAGLAVGLLVTVAAAAACGSSGSTSSGGGAGVAPNVKLGLTAYSTPAEAYQDLIPAFQKTPDGKGVTFSESYGASGAQSRAVAAGLPTDVVELSLAPDIDKLVKSGIVAKDWANDPYRGFVTDSVVVLVVRKGNPKHITGWDDLVRPGVQIITPNPATSGSARWNVMAAYGAQLKRGKSPEQATSWLRSFFKNVTVQDSSGRNALQTFTGGKGDVLISYENEAITAKQKGASVEYLVPAQTILIQNPIAVTLTSKHSAKAARFVTWLRSEQAQKIFAAHGYRPVVSSVLDPKTYPTPEQLFTIDDLGGWPQVTKSFFGEGAVVTEIEKSLGVSTG